MKRSRFKNIKLYVGAMSKNCTDAILDIDDCESKIGFISSRRQVDLDHGYVNNWSTKDFVDYVKSRNNKITLCRDHGGPSQGQVEDDGLDSLLDDSNYLDIVHIDPWKKYKSIEAGTKETVNLIRKVYSKNPNIFFEVGTEESIRKFSCDDLELFLCGLKDQLTDSQFDQIAYCVIQSGVGLDLINMKNTGTFSEAKILRMISICKKYGLMTKEHNSDYLTRQQLEKRFRLGLDAANIAPELGQIETIACLRFCDNENKDNFYKVCLKSNRWKKWVNESFDPEKDKSLLIRICGHYVFAQRFCQEKFMKNKSINNFIIEKIKERVTSLVSV